MDKKEYRAFVPVLLPVSRRKSTNSWSGRELVAQLIHYLTEEIVECIFRDFEFHNNIVLKI